MKEKRTAQINNIKIKANDIRVMANIIHDEYSRFLQYHKERVDKGKKFEPDEVPGIAYEITTKDDVEYSSDSIKSFETGGTLDTKVIKEFNFRLYYPILDAGMSVAITDSQFVSYPHRIVVEGTDSTWVNGTFSRLIEATNSCEKQDTIFKRFRWPISIVFGIIVGFIVGWIFTIPLEKSAGALQLFTFISLITFFIVMFFLEDYLRKLWPNIEIVPEPEHERKLDKKRRILYFIMAVIFIPTAITAIVNLWI